MRRLLIAAVVASVSTGASAQWLNYKTPGVPRTRDGKPKLDAPAPKAPDGHPDLTGVWMHEVTTVQEVRRLFGSQFDEDIKNGLPGMEIGTQHKYFFNILVDFKPGDSPLRPQAAALLKERLAQPRPEDLCDPVNLAGFPVAGLVSEPIKIVQAPRVTMVLYEVGNVHRQIYTHGRKLPAQFDLPAYYGYSVGRWERDTFVVDSAGFNDKTALDGLGTPHSDQLRVTERFRRRDFGHLDVEMTFDDPAMYTRPFTIRVPHDLLADRTSSRCFRRTRRTARRSSKNNVAMKGRSARDRDVLRDSPLPRSGRNHIHGQSHLARRRSPRARQRRNTPL